MRAIIVSFLLFVYANALSQSNDSVFVKKIEELTQGFPEGTELSIGIIKNEQRIYYGFKKLNDSIVAINNSDKIFEVGSITKLFTCILVCDLVNKGELSLTDDIQKYYPFPISYENNLGKPISIITLCNHSSGLPAWPDNKGNWNPSNPYSNYDTTDLYSFLKKKIKLKSAPGSKYYYTNVGYAILGNIICRVTGKTYFDLVKNIILEPLNMNKTYKEVSSYDSSELIVGLNEKGKPTPYWDFKSFEGAGSLKSNAKDILTFVESQFLKKSSIDKDIQLCKQVTFPLNENYGIGLGWEIMHDNTDTVYYRDGGTKGFTASILFSTEKKLGTIVLSNLSGTSRYEGNIDKLNFFLLQNQR